MSLFLVPSQDERVDQSKKEIMQAREDVVKLQNTQKEEYEKYKVCGLFLVCLLFC